MIMLRPRWRKLLRDLWGNKTRTALVVLSIAIGVFAVGMIVASRTILARDLAAGYAATNPASARLMVSYMMIGGDEGFDDDLVEVVRRMPGVAEAEGRRGTSVRLQVGPDEWRDLRLFAISDYDNMRINKVWPESGAWPPPYRAMLIERSGMALTHAAVGDAVMLKTPDGRLRRVSIAGLAHDLGQMPSFLDGTICGYVTFDTLEWLGEPRNYNELSIVVSGDAGDKLHVQAVAADVRAKIEKSGRAVLMTIVYEPGTAPLSDALDTVILVLGVLGFFSLLLSAFLVVNTISSVLAQQTRQIGIFKGVGARSAQIRGLYLAMVLIFGVLALLLSLPAGALAARNLTMYMANLFNFDILDATLPVEVLALQTAVALAIPVIAALPVVIVKTRISASEAMSDVGLSGGASRTRDGRFMALHAWLGRVGGTGPGRIAGVPTLLAIRNTFRRKLRLSLTLITLILGGAIVISVFSVRDALLATLDDMLATYHYDIQISFNRPYRIEHIESIARHAPGVVAVRGSGLTITRRVRADDTESDLLMLMAPPIDADLIEPVMVKGRWLRPDDHQAIVISSYFLRTEPDLRMGDEIVLKIDGRDTRWRIVGECQFMIPIAYVGYEDLALVSRDVGRASSVWVVTTGHDLATQSAVARDLEQRYDRAGVKVTSVVKIAEERGEFEAMFGIIVALLLIMAALLAFVGGLGLTGMLSINVLERTREIGVMRAIGGSDGAIMRVVMLEGLLIGLISWAIAALVAAPLGEALSAAVGAAFMQSSLNYTYSVSGALIWLVVVLVLATVASLLPAWHAARLTVRDVLAYE